MRGRRVLWAGALVALLAGCGLSVEPPEGSGEEDAAVELGAAPRRAALVVEDGNGEGESDLHCLEVEPAEDGTVDGQALLEASGLEHTVQFFRDQQSYALCSVGDAGCRFPDKSCFCGPEYWSAWRLEDGGWVSFEQGLSHWEVEDGQVWGLRLGDGATPPGDVAFGEICG